MVETISDATADDMKVQNGSVPTGEVEQGQLLPAEKSTESLEEARENAEPQKGGEELDTVTKPEVNEQNQKTEKESDIGNVQTEEDKVKIIPTAANTVEIREAISEETGEKEEENRIDLSENL